MFIPHKTIRWNFQNQEDHVYHNSQSLLGNGEGLSSCPCSTDQSLKHHILLRSKIKPQNSLLLVVFPTLEKVGKNNNQNFLKIYFLAIPIITKAQRLLECFYRWEIYRKKLLAFAPLWQWRSWIWAIHYQSRGSNYLSSAAFISSLTSIAMSFPREFRATSL